MLLTPSTAGMEGKGGVRRAAQTRWDLACSTASAVTFSMSLPSFPSQGTKAERGTRAKPPGNNLGTAGVTSRCTSSFPSAWRAGPTVAPGPGVSRGSSRSPLSDLDPPARLLRPGLPGPSRGFLIRSGLTWGGRGASRAARGLLRATLAAGAAAERAQGAGRGAGARRSPRGAQAGARGGQGGLIPYVNGSQWRVVLRGAGIRAGANGWQSYWDYRTKSLPALPLSAPLPAPRPALRRSPRRGWGPPSASPPAGPRAPAGPPPRPAPRSPPARPLRRSAPPSASPSPILLD